MNGNYEIENTRHNHLGRSVAISPDGLTIAATARHNFQPTYIKIWEWNGIDDWEEKGQQPLQGNSGGREIYDVVSFSYDGNLFCTLC